MIKIVIVFGKIKDLEEVKQESQKVTCPVCRLIIFLGVEINILNKLNSNIYFPHIHLHGDPLHALICYINSELKLRNIGVIKSIEISRDSQTFAQLMKKWTNPY
ncbi:MAG: hypothetical protein ACFE75_10975 [Candidatus Hodarchaeota archaeon]